jgi:hypothetical protein
MSSVPSSWRLKLNVSTLLVCGQSKMIRSPRMANVPWSPTSPPSSQRPSRSVIVTTLPYQSSGSSVVPARRAPSRVSRQRYVPSTNAGSRARRASASTGSEQAAGTSTGGAGGNCAFKARISAIACRVPGSRSSWE